jgi:hypothetical protein
MDYKNKYLKYKSKYLTLKKLLKGGGGKYLTNIKILIKALKGESKYGRDIGILWFLKKHDFELDDYIDELKEIADNIDLFKEKVFYKNGQDGKPLKDILIEKWKKNEIARDEILTFFKIIIPKVCTIYELMTEENVKDECINFNRVIGSCGFPYFLTSNNDISEEDKDKWIELLTLIESKLDGLNYIDFVIGAMGANYTAFESKENNFTVCINPYYDYEKIDVLITVIKSTDSLLDKNYRIRGEFPLSHNFSNSSFVLNKILEMNKKVPVRITNRMCGTCFRSLYYLVQKGIPYVVEPEQGLNKIMDTPEIRECFKKPM